MNNNVWKEEVLKWYRNDDINWEKYQMDSWTIVPQDTNWEGFSPDIWANVNMLYQLYERALDQDNKSQDHGKSVIVPVAMAYPTLMALENGSISRILSKSTYVYILSHDVKTEITFGVYQVEIMFVEAKPGTSIKVNDIAHTNNPLIITWLDSLIAVARVVSMRSQSQIGCVIFEKNSHNILSTGYTSGNKSAVSYAIQHIKSCNRKNLRMVITNIPFMDDIELLKDAGITTVYYLTELPDADCSDIVIKAADYGIALIHLECTDGVVVLNKREIRAMDIFNSYLKNMGLRLIPVSDDMKRFEYTRRDVNIPINGKLPAIHPTQMFIDATAGRKAMIMNKKSSEKNTEHHTGCILHIPGRSEFVSIWYGDGTNIDTVEHGCDAYLYINVYKFKNGEFVETDGGGQLDYNSKKTNYAISPYGAEKPFRKLCEDVMSFLYGHKDIPYLFIQVI